MNRRTDAAVSSVEPSSMTTICFFACGYVARTTASRVLRTKGPSL